MTPRRLLPRVLFLVAVLALFGIGGYQAWLQSWRSGQMLDLAARSEVVKLPAGEMEFAVRGSGEPVLVFHSAPGGYDQSLALCGFLEDAGFEILAPSRPGYLRTPLSTGPSPETQAEAAAQLLDHLEIPKAAFWDSVGALRRRSSSPSFFPIAPLRWFWFPLQPPKLLRPLERLSRRRWLIKSEVTQVRWVF